MTATHFHVNVRSVDEAAGAAQAYSTSKTASGALTHLAAATAKTHLHFKGATSRVVGIGENNLMVTLHRDGNEVASLILWPCTCTAGERELATRSQQQRVGSAKRRQARREASRPWNA